MDDDGSDEAIYYATRKGSPKLPFSDFSFGSQSKELETGRLSGEWVSEKRFRDGIRPKMEARLPVTFDNRNRNVSSKRLNSLSTLKKA